MMEANIIVAFPRLDDARNIRNILVRNGIGVSAVATSGRSALAAADGLDGGIIVTSYKHKDMPYFEIYENMPERFELLLIASWQRLSECDIPDIVKLPMPFIVSDLIGTIEMMTGAAAAGKGSGRPKRGRTAEEEKTLDMAKRILIERNGLTENEAHKYIQKCSMDSGTGLIESARMIMSMYDSLG